MRQMPSVAVDLMGSDKGSEEICRGIRELTEKRTDIRIFAVGDPQMEIELLGCPRVEFVRADHIVTAETRSTEVLRCGSSSVAVAVGLVKQGRAGAILSFGDTRSLVLRAMHKKCGLGLLDGIEKTPLALVVPWTDGKGKVVIVDAGANIDCRPKDLIEFARLGRAFSQAVLNLEEPRVALLANGEEEKKGNALTKATFKMLQDMDFPGFKGNVQASDALSGDCDVIITDGFAGNIDFKAMECGVKIVTATLRRSLKMSLRTMIGAWLIRPATDEVKRQLDSSQFGSMPMLGFRSGVVMVGHGSADHVAVARGIEEAARYVELGLPAKMAGMILTDGFVKIPEV